MFAVVWCIFLFLSINLISFLLTTLASRNIYTAQTLQPIIVEMITVPIFIHLFQYLFGISTPVDFDILKLFLCCFHLAPMCLFVSFNLLILTPESLCH